MMPLFLLSLQYFIVNSQSSQKQQERLQFLSFRDMLTGLYNRNKYMKVLKAVNISRSAIQGLPILTLTA